MSLRTLRDWNTGDSNRDRGHLQEPPEAIRELQHLVAPPTGSRASTDPVPLEFGLAKIVSKGPNGEADYTTDARYWIQRILVKSGKLADAVKVAEDTTDQDDDNSPPNIFTATNWPERQGGSHSLATDGTVEVMYVGVYDAGDPQKKHYLFHRVVTTDYSFYASAVGTGTDLGAHKGGIYDGYCFKSVGVGGRVIPPTGGIFCRIIVDDESDSGSGGPGTGDEHWAIGVATTGWGQGRFEGEYTAEATPRMIIRAESIPPTISDKGTIVPFNDAQQWVRDAPYVDPTNLANTVVGDVAPTLVMRMANGKQRTLYFDASGRLRLISPGT